MSWPSPASAAGGRDEAPTLVRGFPEERLVEGALCLGVNGVHLRVVIRDEEGA